MKNYTITITYRDGMVAQFDESPESLLFSVAQRILANEVSHNVKEWKIEPHPLVKEGQTPDSKEPPYSLMDYAEAKKMGLDLDDWKDYQKYFRLGEDTE